MSHAPETPRPSPADAAPARPSGRRGWRLLVRTVLVVLLALAGTVAALPTLLSRADRLPWLLATLAPELRDAITCGGLRLGWFGPLALEELRISAPGDRPVAAIPRVTCSRGLAAILVTGGDLGDVRIEQPRVDVVFDDERRSNLAGLFPPDDGPAVRSDHRGPRSSPLRLRLEVVDAVVSIAGPWTADPWIGDPIRLRATLAPAADAAWSEWSIEPVQLFAQARLDPPVAQGVLAYIAPVLADATRTGGRFSLRLDGARLPVGNPEAGTLAGVLSMHEVSLGPGPLVNRLLESLPGGLPEPPTIRIAEDADVAFRLADRRVWHDGLAFGLPLLKPGQRLDVESSGSVGLDDGTLALKLKLPIPADLPQDRPLLAALAGKQISLGIGGHLGAPRIDFDGSIRQTATAVIGDLADRLRERGRAAADNAARGTDGAPRAADGSAPAAESGGTRPADDTAAAVVDLIGGVLDEVAKRRAERRAAEAAGELPPRRRGGLLRRLTAPPDPATGPRPPPEPKPASGGDAPMPPRAPGEAVPPPRPGWTPTP